MSSAPFDRSRAIACVTRYILAYQALPRWKTGVQAKIEHLQRELGIMQGDGHEGETLARRWDFVVFG